jgi:hypothetical protein
MNSLISAFDDEIKEM